MRAAARQGTLGAMGNPYGITLDDASLRWAAAEGVPELVIAAICLLDEKSVDEIVAKLSPVELEQVIKIVGRSPRGYPPGAYDALKEHRRTPSPEHAANVSAVTNRAKVPLNASQRATANPYGITLNRAWTDWAAQHGVSETIAAALYLLSENRKAGEVLVKLAPGEMERVIAFVQRWPDHFPPGALFALKESRPTPPERSAASGSPGVGSAQPATLINPGIGQLREPRVTPAQPRAVLRSAAEHATVELG